MKQDLRRLVKAEDAFRARNSTYTGVLPQEEFATRPERRVIVVAHGDKGYGATLTTTEELGLTCGLYDGIGVAPSPVISSARNRHAGIRLQAGPSSPTDRVHDTRYRRAPHPPPSPSARIASDPASNP